MFAYLATAIAAVGLLGSTPQAPHWEASYGKALEATRASEAPLLVVLDKPNSDAARVKPELLGEDGNDPQERELLKPYRLCHVDVTTEYGQKVASAFKATSFPHVAIIDKTGSQVIFRKTGQVKTEEWQQILSDHRTGVGPVRRVLSRLTGKPVDNGSSRPYCPNCQRHTF